MLERHQPDLVPWLVCPGGVSNGRARRGRPERGNSSHTRSQIESLHLHLKVSFLNGLVI
jgi:hypothetical protein